MLKQLKSFITPNKQQEKKNGVSKANSSSADDGFSPTPRRWKTCGFHAHQRQSAINSHSSIFWCAASTNDPPAAQPRASLLVSLHCWLDATLQSNRRDCSSTSRRLQHSFFTLGAHQGGRELFIAPSGIDARGS